MAESTKIEDLEDGEIESDDETTTEIENGVNNEINNSELPNMTHQNTEPQNTKYEEISESYYSKSSKKKKSKRVQKYKDKKKSRKYSEKVEEDHAGKIEKAIRKVMNKNNESDVDNDNEERRKYKKRKKYDKEGPREKRKRLELSDDVDESEMMCVRGASPVQKSSPPPDDYHDDHDDRNSYSSESSNDSRNHHRSSRSRHQKDRNKSKQNDRRRGLHQMQDADGVCLYYMQGKCHKGDECAYSHDALPPRKMELCKFYLMDCCAKRDKCLYMHSDFPCKYYHTGLPCVYKDECKFAHGKPLTENLKNILLKHIESAPKEILGDFPRLNKEGAAKMIQSTQSKLMAQYGEPQNTTEKIPSLFELNIPNPLETQESHYNTDKMQNKISPKSRQSRWQNDLSNQTFSVNGSPPSSDARKVLSINNLTGVLAPRQISDLTKMGIENLDQLSQLTVLQLNSIGISLKQITEIQLNTMNIQKLGLLNNSAEQNTSQIIGNVSGTKDLDLRVPPIVSLSNNLSSEIIGKDIDMRFQPAAKMTSLEESINIKTDNQPDKDMIDINQYAKDALKFISKDKENIDISNETYENEKLVISNEAKDVDHRVLPFSDESINTVPSVLEKDPIKKGSDTDIRFFQPYKSPEKRQRLSTTDDEDDNLLIDEKWYSSDEEKGGKRKSPTNSPHHTISSSQPQHSEQKSPKNKSSLSILNKLGDLSKIDISEQVTKLLNTMKNNLVQENNTESTIEAVSSPKSRDPRSVRRSPEKSGDSGKLPSSKRSPRVSIYECVDGEPTDGRRRTDVDLRKTDYKLPGFGDTDLRQTSSGDIDFRLGLPFKAIPNYTPASEIDCSINNHPLIPYKLIPIDIPRPDYTDIRNSTAKSQALVDPRLRKVFRLSLDESPDDSEKVAKPVTNTPRVDPRRKHKDISENLQEQKSNTLELQNILQNSGWYKELSSTQKIFVNQHLAPVTQMIKQYQQEKQQGKIFDITPIKSNAILANIFSNLGITLNENGEFSNLPKPKEALLKTPVNFNQNSSVFTMSNNMPIRPGAMESGNINMMNMPVSISSGGGGGGPSMNNMNVMPGFNQQFPDIRPGLLGIAPNIPHNFNTFGGQNNFGSNMPYNIPPGQGNNAFNFEDKNYPRFQGRGGQNRGHGNERWNRGGAGRGNNRERKNFSNRGNWKNDRN